MAIFCIIVAFHDNLDLPELTLINASCRRHWAAKPKVYGCSAFVMLFNAALMGRRLTIKAAGKHKCKSVPPGISHDCYH